MAGVLILTEKPVVDVTKMSSNDKYKEVVLQKQRFKLTFATPGFAANINKMTDDASEFMLKTSGY
jgi:hypothetical protein